MQKFILCVLFSAFLGHSALAQTAPAQFPTSPAPSVGHADTLRAVQHLYSRHRTGGTVWLVIGGLFTLQVATASGGADNASGTVVGIAVFGGLPAAVGLGKAVRFSDARETVVINDYQRGRGLPPYVSRRLHRKDFR